MVDEAYIVYIGCGKIGIASSEPGPSLPDAYRGGLVVCIVVRGFHLFLVGIDNVLKESRVNVIFVVVERGDMKRERAHWEGQWTSEGGIDMRLCRDRFKLILRHRKSNPRWLGRASCRNVATNGRNEARRTETTMIRVYSKV